MKDFKPLVRPTDWELWRDFKEGMVVFGPLALIAAVVLFWMLLA